MSAATTISHDARRVTLALLTLATPAALLLLTALLGACYYHPLARHYLYLVLTCVGAGALVIGGMLAFDRRAVAVTAWRRLCDSPPARLTLRVSCGVACGVGMAVYWIITRDLPALVARLWAATAPRREAARAYLATVGGEVRVEAGHAWLTFVRLTSIVVRETRSGSGPLVYVARPASPIEVMHAINEAALATRPVVARPAAEAAEQAAPAAEAGPEAPEAQPAAVVRLREVRSRVGAVLRAGATEHCLMCGSDPCVCHLQEGTGTRQPAPMTVKERRNR